ncbi:hypothetical protein [Thioalkalivibrio sp. ALE11]|nr:hypothetical protein [Thioalkalivibrio sp. ALE11]
MKFEMEKFIAEFPLSRNSKHLPGTGRMAGVTRHWRIEPESTA